MARIRLMPSETNTQETAASELPHKSNPATRPSTLKQTSTQSPAEFKTINFKKKPQSSKFHGVRLIRCENCYRCYVPDPKTIGNEIYVGSFEKVNLHVNYILFVL